MFHGYAVVACKRTWIGDLVENHSTVPSRNKFLVSIHVLPSTVVQTVYLRVTSQRSCSTSRHVQRPCKNSGLHDALRLVTGKPLASVGERVGFIFVTAELSVWPAVRPWLVE